MDEPFDYAAYAKAAGTYEPNADGVPVETKMAMENRVVSVISHSARLYGVSEADFLASVMVGVTAAMRHPEWAQAVLQMDVVKWASEETDRHVDMMVQAAPVERLTRERAADVARGMVGRVREQLVSLGLDFNVYPEMREFFAELEKSADALATVPPQT